ncbi:MAG: lamin tail domain-containing protein [Erysipelotrichaceae bacterium]
MAKIRKKMHPKDKLVLGLIAIIVGISFLLSILVRNSTILKPVDSELGEEESDATGLVINEIMTANNGAVADPSGNLYDWVELYNGGDQAINLKNYGLSDSMDKTKWAFRNITIQPKSYLVIYLSGTKRDGPYASFRLVGAGGETLVLRNPSGNVLASYHLPEIESNKSIGRNAEGKWVVYSQPTPGYENTLSGYQAYLTQRKAVSSPLKITEVLPRNQGNFLDKTFGFPGYIEITNLSDKTIDLKGYYLGETADVAYRWKFPDVSLRAGKSMVVYTSGTSVIEGRLSTNFRLNEFDGSVMLADNTGKILDQADYNDNVKGYAIIWNTDHYVQQPYLSPGYPNDAEGVADYNASRGLPSGLIISEAMNNNTKYLLQNGGEHYDWIELKNNSKAVIHLGEYTLTTTQNNPDEYTLPQVDLKPGEFYILMASGDVNLSNTSYKHMNFKLGDVESLYLYHSGKIVDAAFLAEIPVNYSLSRTSSGGFVYSSQPTPKAANNEGYSMVSATPQTSLRTGVYNNVKTLLLRLETQGNTYYTLDGSKPTIQSAKYSAPINVTKTTVVRAITIEPRKVASKVATFSYIVNENHVFPVVSVALSPGDFANLQSHPDAMGLEYASHVDLFEGDSGFSVDCGLQLFGGSTRYLPKKSFEMNFRGDYGMGILNYQVFPNRDFSIFNKLVLRSGSQDYDGAYYRDILGSSLMEKSTTVEVQAYKSVVLYINGRYWGIYDIREKVDEYFVSTHYNVDKKTTNVVRADWAVSYGSSAGIHAIVNYANSHDMTLDANYQYILKRLDIDSYIDFWVAEVFVTNNDIINTRYINSTAYDGGKYKMVFYDLDYAFYRYSRDYYAFMIDPAGMSDFKVSTVLMRNLMHNATFRETFLQRLKLNMETIWNEANVKAKVESFYTLMQPEMPRDHARWGIPMSDWEEEVGKLRYYVEVRTSYLLAQTKAFFNLSDAEFRALFGEFI